MGELKQEIEPVSSAYQPNTLPLGQASSLLTVHDTHHFIFKDNQERRNKKNKKCITEKAVTVRKQN